MKTFSVPALEGESYYQYAERVSGIAWVFNGAPSINVPHVGTVELDGEQPNSGEYPEYLHEYVPPPPPPGPVVPQSISPFQARAALLGAGLLDAVEAVIADPATPVMMKLAWNTAQEFRRSSPTIAAMASVLGMSSEQLDSLFIAAAEIEA